MFVWVCVVCGETLPRPIGLLLLREGGLGTVVGFEKYGVQVVKNPLFAGMTFHKSDGLFEASTSHTCCLKVTFG